MAEHAHHYTMMRGFNLWEKRQVAAYRAVWIHWR